MSLKFLFIVIVIDSPTLSFCVFRCLKLNKCQNVGIGIIALNSLHSMDDKSYSCPGAVLLFNRYSAWVKGEYSPLGENM